MICGIKDYNGNEVFLKYQFNIVSTVYLPFGTKTYKALIRIFHEQNQISKAK